MFPLKSNEESEEQAKHENIRNGNGLIDYNKFMELINSKENEMNNELVTKYFFAQKLGTVLKQIKDLKNNPEKNKKLVNVIKSGLKDLQEEIEEMSKEQREIKKPDEIVDFVEKILNQETKGLSTPNQMLSRLPISLAQLQAGNNSQKLQNEIKQLSHSLYRSKNIAKQMYSNLIKYI